MIWLISANASVYDHYSSFMKNGYIDWHQTVKYKIGDIVYIYCTKPVQMIRYKAVVTAINMPFDEITYDKEFWKDIRQYEKSKKDKYCRLVLLNEIYNEGLSLSFLIENGLSCAPQGPQKMSAELSGYISRMLNENENILLESTVDEYGEGKRQLKQHIVRERNPMLVQVAKKKFKQEHGGRLFCEICGFDFFSTYGDIGEDYIEVHHKKPISKMKEGEKTNIEDVAIVCSNCHRMIHRKKPWLTTEDLKSSITQYRKSKKMKEIETEDSSIEYIGELEKLTIHFLGTQTNKKIGSSILAVLPFLIDSYKNSCLQLLHTLKQHIPFNEAKKSKYYATFYLPAMFCFRHYVELKLKYLYAYYGQKTFETNHNLRSLASDLNKVYPNNLFDSVVDYIDSLERFFPEGKTDDTYFRYLVDKNFVVENSLEISLQNIEKVEFFITELEFRIEKIQESEWLRSILASNNK